VIPIQTVMTLNIGAYPPVIANAASEAREVA
jgi:hypothetical protein